VFIAHLPAASLLNRALVRRAGLARTWAWAGLAGAVTPDLDLLYFYLIDGRRHPHHTYWTHLPCFWALGALGVALLSRWLGAAVRSALWFFLANVGLHLVLDTYVGGIAWLYPWSKHELRLFSLPAVHAWWEANFLLHWSFLAEVALCVAAAGAWAYDRARAARPPQVCSPHA
jgi:hypothetical protein